MKKLTYRVIGVMSGTSLDGVDLALIDFVKNRKGWQFKIWAAQTIAYSKAWQDKLETAHLLSLFQIEELNQQYTDYLAQVIEVFLEENDIYKTTLDAVCSHGHTVLHQPERGLTIQIGNLSALAKKINIKVVCDFRVQDVELGGQGAPLVPIGDELLFANYEVCLNLGGFANISLIKNETRLAYDICAVNTVLNFLSKKIGYNFDEDGKIAASGSIDDELLAQLNTLSFYKKVTPKSLGIEWVKENIFPLLATYNISYKDKITTYTYHVAQQIAHQIKEGVSTSVLVTGGGAFNKTLIKYIQSLSDVKVIVPSREIVEYKEALIFGFLGVLKLRNEVNVLRSVTGATKDHSSGRIFLP